MDWKQETMTHKLLEYLRSETDVLGSVSSSVFHLIDANHLHAKTALVARQGDSSLRCFFSGVFKIIGNTDRIIDGVTFRAIGSAMSSTPSNVYYGNRASSHSDVIRLTGDASMLGLSSIWIYSSRFSGDVYISRLRRCFRRVPTMFDVIDMV